MGTPRVGNRRMQTGMWLALLYVVLGTLPALANTDYSASVTTDPTTVYQNASPAPTITVTVTNLQTNTAKDIRSVVLTLPTGFSGTTGVTISRTGWSSTISADGRTITATSGSAPSDLPGGTGTEAMTIAFASTTSGTGSQSIGVVCANRNGGIDASAVSVSFSVTACTAVSTVTTQPASQEVCSGSNASFSAASDGTAGATKLQWQRSTDAGSTWANISGATTSPLAVSSVTESMSGYRYRAVFSSLCGASTATSDAATLTVPSAASVSDPTSQSVISGNGAEFTVTPSSGATLQWQISTDAGASYSDISGATGTSLSLVSVTTSMSGNRYRAIATTTCSQATSSGATLTVSPITTTTTISPATATYGDASVTLVATVSPSAADGSVSFSIDGAPVGSGTLSAGSASISYNPSALTGGLHTIDATYGGASEYSGSTGTSATLTITKAPLTVTAQDATREYGDANPGFSVSYAGFVNGDNAASLGGTLVVTTTATSTSAIGTWPITASGYTSDNYEISYTDGTLTIEPATLTITAPSPTRDYGEANPPLDGGFSGARNGETFAVTGSTTATSTSPVGTYSVVPAVTGATLANYDVVPVNGKLTVESATLTITAPSPTREYGDANPSLDGNFSGAKNGETFAVTGSTTATTTSPVGTYAVVPAVTGATLANYDVVPVNGTLTIESATLTITAPSPTREYGDANPSLDGNFAGAKNGETFAVTGSTTATSTSPVGTYAVVPAVTGATLANYDVVPVNGTLTVESATLTITAPSPTREYGDANPSLDGNFTGAKNGETFAVTGSTTATTTSPVGTYDVVPAVTGATLANYDVVPVNGTLTVESATLTITAPSPTREYGDANPSLDGGYSGAKNGETFVVTGSTTATASSPVGTYDVVPAVTGATLANYDVVPVNGTLTVEAATLTITAPSPTREYGDANPSLDGNYSGAKNGETFIVTGSTTAMATSPVGTYDVIPAVTGATLANYDVVPVNGTLTIESATLTITAPSPTREYGDANPSLDGNYSGAKNGETFVVTGSTTATETSPVGTYDVVPAVTGATLANYDVVPVNGTLTVEAATLTITAPSPTREYGDANPSLDGNYSGAKNGETFVVTGSTTATETSPVGTYDVIPAVTGATLANYDVVPVNGTLTVESATLTITAPSPTREYGDANPSLDGNYSGAKNGETFVVTGSTTATTTSPVGTYSVVPAVTGATLANYDVVPVNGTLTIESATLTITAPSPTREYGDANPSLDGNYSGAKNGETFVVTGSTTATATSPVGTYDVIPAVTGATLANYDVVPVNGTLTVESATLTITAPSPTREYGDANPSLDGNFSGAKNGETFAVTGSTTATSTSPVGTYAVVPAVTGATLANYDVVPVNGTLTVEVATLTITAPSPTREYGDANPSLDGGYSGAKNGEIFVVTGSTTATATSPVGTYDVIPAVTGATLANYDVVPVNGTLTVESATLTITAPSPTREYGDANPSLDGGYSGAKNGETFVVTGSTTATATSPVGTYDVVPAVTGATLANYDVVPVNGTLTVESATLTITAPSPTREYGDANPSLDGNFSGAKNGETFVVTGSTAATATSPVGTYDVIPAVTGATLANYDVAPVNGTLTVESATLTITAPSPTREYGDANPSLDGNYSGAKNGETFVVTGSTTATATSSVGTYDVIPAVTGATLANYDVVPVNGTLTVEAATLTITAPSPTREYGDANPSLDGNYSGAKNGETFVVTGSTTATATSPVGTYDVVPAVTGATLANYDVVPVNG
ncbi:MAG TPA: MBG domain-containing protein, partial [Candidatus Kapabacteria bacterium]|nr:MBG domain-containing protein [Candidatus Kapabacteria bacterium]